jgi:hypothetical protein
MPAIIEHFHVATVRSPESLEDLHRRRLAGAIRAEHAEALAAVDLEIESRQGGDVTVPLDEASAPDRSVRTRGLRHSPSVYVRT